MKTKDYLFVALLPLALLLIPLTGKLTLEGWNWSGSDYFFAWVIFSITTFIYRFLAARKFANFAYKAGAGLAVLTGFLVVWITAAVQIIGDENPANVLYLGVILTGLSGVALSRFQPAGMAKTAFATAAVTFVVPIVGVILKPSDFSPGIPQVFMLNGFFVVMFAVSGLLFRQAASQPHSPAVATTA